MPSQQFGIINLSKYISKPKPMQVVVISGLKRDDKVSVLSYWSKGQVIVKLATQATKRINLSKAIKAMTPEASDWEIQAVFRLLQC